MNRKVKMSLFALVALIGLFVGNVSIDFNTEKASAQTVVDHCDYATIYGEVTTGGTEVWAWFKWGPADVGLVNHTAKRGPFTSNTQMNERITNLKPNTEYTYELIISNGTREKSGGIRDFTTPSCDNGNPNPNPGPKPYVTLYANPTRIPYGGSSTIEWYSNADSCISNGGSQGWGSNNRSPSGSFYANDLTKTTTYSISCSNDNGTSDTKTVTVNVDNQEVLDPTGTISAKGCNIRAGESTCNAKLTWSVSNPKSGASTEVTRNKPNGSVSTARSATDFSSQNTAITYGTTTFFLYHDGEELDDTTVQAYCESASNWNGSSCQKGNYDLSVDLTADKTTVDYGESTTLRWTSSGDIARCEANGGWTGSKNPSGSASTGTLKSTTNFYITCYDRYNHSANDSVKVTVNAQQQTENPTVNLTATPSSITRGESSRLEWHAENATSCSATWTSSGSIEGYKNVYPNSTTTYSITCYGNGKQASDSVTVTVNDNQGGAVSVDLSADRTSLDYGESTYLRWNADNATSCTASGAWSGSKDPGNGRSLATGALYSTKTYTLTCYGNGGSDSDSVTIYVNNDNNNDYQPTVETRSATDVQEDRATLRGYVDSNGGRDTEVWFEWGTSSSFGNETEREYVGQTNGEYFDKELRGLRSGKTYYFRAVGRNDNGDEVYGSRMSFTTDDNNDNCDYYDDCNDNGDLYVTTYPATGVTESRATLNGYVDSSTSSTTGWFEWGTSRSRLSHTTSKERVGSRNDEFDDVITGLAPNTTYYFRAVARNSDGTDEGSIRSFTTRGDYYKPDYPPTPTDQCMYGACTPTAITTVASNIGQTSARLNGLALGADGTYATGYFEYGTTYSLGRTTASQPIGSFQSMPFYQNVSGLAQNTTYYFRAVVTNQYGTSRGDIMSFRTGRVIVYSDTSTGSNIVYKNTTVVSNSSSVVAGTSRPSLVYLSVSRNEEMLRIGEIVDYVVNYKNVSSKDLRNVVLRVSLPGELDFMETTRGSYSQEDRMVVVNIGDLFPQEEGSVRVTAVVREDAQINKTIVVTANLAYTIAETGAQEEVFAYSRNTIGEGRLGLGAASIFGVGFLPSTLLGWLLLILIILLLVAAVRWLYDRPARVVTTPPQPGH